MVTLISIGAYALVAAALLAYSRITGGPYANAADFALDLLFCALWPLSLAVLAFCWLCDRLFWGFSGCDGGRERK